MPAGRVREPTTTARRSPGRAPLHNDLISVERWQRHGNALVRELDFRDSDEAVVFASRAAAEAVDYARRPEHRRGP
jgi:pterin-4a-carbinolamine dehydratase